MQVVSKFNPLTYIVDAERVLFAGTFGSLTILWGFVAAFATAAVGVVVGIRSIRKATI
jgi:ABC-2 type transport system permease protein